MSPSSSEVALAEEVGGNGSGKTGVRVGSIDGTSAADDLWLSFGLLLLVPTPGIDREAGARLSAMACGAF